MKKTTKKRLTGVIAFAMAFVMVGAFCGCGSGSEEAGQTDQTETAATEETANPVHEMKDARELALKTGVEIDAPEGAENVTYSYIDASEPDGAVVGQVEFTLDGVDYCYRSMDTGMTNINDYIKDTEYKDVAEAMMDGAEVGTDISGMYGPWDAAALVTVQGRDGVCAINDGKEGVVIWLDIVPGIMYSLSTGDGADQDALMNIAETNFVPMQGEADGE